MTSIRRWLCLLFSITAGWCFGEGEPIRIGPGETASNTLVSISEPIRIEGRAAKGVFTAGATLTISGVVEGDVAVVGGKLALVDGGRIRGNVLLLGSTQEFSPQSRIEGKLFSYSFLGQDIRQIFTNPAQFLLSYEYDLGFIASRFFVSLFWFLLSILVIKLFPAHINFACSRLRRDPGYTAGVGLVGFTGLTLLLLVSLALSLILIGIPLVLILLLFSLLLWAFGMVVLFCTVGEWLLRLFRVRTPSPLLALVVAILVWTLIKFLPGVSLLVHLAALIMSFGISLTTRFGSGLPWFKARRAIPAEPSFS